MISDVLERARCPRVENGLDAADGEGAREMAVRRQIALHRLVRPNLRVAVVQWNRAQVQWKRAQGRDARLQLFVMFRDRLVWALNLTVEGLGTIKSTEPMHIMVQLVQSVQQASSVWGLKELAIDCLLLTGKLDALVGATCRALPESPYQSRRLELRRTFSQLRDISA